MSSDEEITTDNPTYLAIACATKWLQVLTSTIFMTLVLISKCREKSVRIRFVTVYFLCYELAAILDAVDQTSDTYNADDSTFFITKYDETYDIIMISCFVLSHELFFIVMIERLHYPFKETTHQTPKHTLLILLVISFVLEAYHWSLRFMTVFTDHFSTFFSIHIVLWCIFCALSSLFAILLTYIFLQKLVSVLLSVRRTMHFVSCSELITKTPSRQFSELSRMSLSPHQLVLVRAITRNSYLSVMAIVFRSLEVIFFVISTASLHAGHHGTGYSQLSWLYIWNIGGNLLLNLFLFGKFLMVYLLNAHFVGSRRCYTRCCAKKHYFIYKRAMRYAQRKVALASLRTIAMKERGPEKEVNMDYHALPDEEEEEDHDHDAVYEEHSDLSAANDEERSVQSTRMTESTTLK